ncbi:MAG: anaerobic carbon-monoxide dehydrogenase catalytic subunit [Bacillota bacterium]
MKERVSMDENVMAMLDVAQEQGIETIWDRYRKQLPQCGFGESGLCCRNCLQGPCRLDPFEDGPTAGVCGAGADTIVARNLIRAIAAGTASHSGHAKHLAHVLKKVADGKAADYAVKDEAKLRSVAARLGIETEGRSVQELAKKVADAALADFSEREKPIAWAATTITRRRAEALARLGSMPMGIDSAISKILHRTTLGVDADPVNLLIGGVEGAIADYAGCHMGTDLADILFGTPQPVVTEANMGVLKEKAVNIALHGHNPVLSEIIVQAAREVEMTEEAREAGAEEGINLVGICCTGNEVLMRHGVPPLTHSVSQEMPILTGALDAMVVDYQCVYPSLSTVAGCYGTKLVTTMEIGKIPGATHVELREDEALEKAREIIRLAIAAYKARREKPVNIPRAKSPTVAGFSAEAIVTALAKLDAADPLKPLIDNIVNGNIQGIVLFAGCNNVKVPQDKNYLVMAKELARRDVLLLATGCGAGAFARHGLLTGEATNKHAGPGLKTVLTAIGEANGLGGPLPLILHMGSCVDNSRAVDVAVAVANRLGVDTDKLPVAASAPEYKTEKAVAIGTWAVAAGLPTHLGLIPPLFGSKLVTRVLTEDVKTLLGGYFIVEPDPLRAAEKVYAAIQERRAGLNLATRSW